MRNHSLFKYCYIVVVIVTTIIIAGYYVTQHGFQIITKESETMDSASQGYLIEGIDLVKSNAEEIKWNAKFVKSTKKYFDDALFIGDSRTVGIDYYGNINNADFFSNVGMSIWNLPSTRVDVVGKGEYDIYQLLEKYKYGKIYIMMGINEAGGNLKEIELAYKKFLGKVRKLNPDAIIFVCANLHVTKDRSDSDSRINNANIDNINRRQRSLVDNKKIFYLDANEIFDDESGALNPETTGDNTHLYASYYEGWVKWLLTKTVRPDKDEK